MTMFRRPPAEVRVLVEPGERALSWAETSDGGWLVATDDSLRCSAPAFGRHWVEILGASWREPQLEIKVWQPEFGPVATEVFTLEGADVLPQVVRERIMQSLLVQKHVALVGAKGVRFLARRDPKTDEVSWQRLLDPGIDPSDPTVRQRIDEALTVLRDAYGV